MNKYFLNIIDFLLLGYTTMAGSYLVLQNELDSFAVAEWCIFLLCYFVIRRIPNKQWCLWGIALLGMTEAIVAFCQRMYWIDNTYSIFNMTGTFANPGPLGGFLAVTTIVTFGLYLGYRKHLWVKYSLLPIFILLLIIIVQTDSRAGWLAALLGIGSFSLEKIKKERNFFSNFQKVSVLIFATLFLIFVYYYKKDSADGHLLIWRVSAEMIADAPFLGHGVGAFEKQYMHYQARYFDMHPSSRYVRLADNIAYPYNEFLRIGVELGLVGLALVIGIIVCVFKYVPYRGNNRIYLGAFVSWFTFSMFSYPFHVPLLWLLLPILLGGMQCRKSMCVRVGYGFKFIEWLVGLVCLSFIMQNGYNHYLLKHKVEQLYSSSRQDVEEAVLYIEQHRLDLQSDSQLFDIYAQYCYQNFPLPKRKTFLEEAVAVIPNSELYCDLGDTYKALNQIEKAVSCYVMASNMVPNRILPNYKLFCLYREIGDTIKMRKAGEKALNTQLKVESTKTLRIKGDLKRSLG